jgi:hypothetical protein
MMGIQLVFRFEQDKWLIKVSTESVACAGATQGWRKSSIMRCDRANQDGQLHLDILDKLCSCAVCIF